MWKYIAIGSALIATAGKWLYDKVLEMKAYDITHSTMEQTAAVDKDFDEFKNNIVVKFVDESEKKYVSACEEILKSLENILNNDEKIIMYFEKEKQKLINSIKGSFYKEIIPYVSLDNEELLKILIMSPGKEKGNAMKLFLHNCFKKCLRSSKNNFIDGLQSICDNVDNLLNDKIVQNEGIAKNNLDTLNSLKENTNINNKEYSYIELAENLCISQYALNLVRSHKHK